MNYLCELIFFFLIVVQNAGECSSGKDECNGHGFFGSVSANGICECLCDVGYIGQFCTETADVLNMDCPSGQFPLLGGFIFYQAMHNSEIRSVDCPGGFAGSARLQCKAGTVNLLGGSCWIVYHVDTQAPTQAPTNSVIYLTPGPIIPSVAHISSTPTPTSSKKSITTTSSFPPMLTSTSSSTEQEEEEEIFDETVKNEEAESNLLPIVTGSIILVLILMVICYAFYRFRKTRTKIIQFKRMEEGDDIALPSEASPHVILFDENDAKTPKMEKPDSLFNLKEGFQYSDYITKSANTMTSRSRAPTFTIQFDTNPSNIPEVDLYGVGPISPIYSEGGQYLYESDSELGESEVEDLYQNDTCPRYGEETCPTTLGSPISQHHPQLQQPQPIYQNQNNQNFHSRSIGQYSVDSSQSEEILEKNHRIPNDIMQSNSQTSRNPCRYSYSSDGHNVYRYYRHFHPGMDNKKQTNGETSIRPTRKFVTKKNYSKVTGERYYSDEKNFQNHIQPTTTSPIPVASSFVSNLVKKFSPRKTKHHQLPPLRRKDFSHNGNGGDFYNQNKKITNHGIQDHQQQKYNFAQISGSCCNNQNNLAISSSSTSYINTPQFQNPIPPSSSDFISNNIDNQQAHHHPIHPSRSRKRDPSISSQYMQHDYTE